MSRWWTHVLVVLALVLGARVEPEAASAAHDRDAYAAALQPKAAHLAKRAGAAGVEGRAHARAGQLDAIAGPAFALARPPRALLGERAAAAAAAADTAAPARRGARAPPRA